MKFNGSTLTGMADEIYRNISHKIKIFFEYNSCQAKIFASNSSILFTSRNLESKIFPNTEILFFFRLSYKNHCTENGNFRAFFISLSIR